MCAPMVRALRSGAKVMTRRLMDPQPPSYEDVRALYGDYHLAELKPDGNWRTMGSVWAVRKLLGTDCREGRTGEWKCPYGSVGTRLYVKEGFTHITGNGVRIHYRADGEPLDREGKPIPHEAGTRRWMSPLFMSRKQSRLQLEVWRVRVQRLHEITEDDAKREGVTPFFTQFPEIGRDQKLTTGEYARDAEHRAAFAVLWDELNGKRALWITNPWVWAVDFRVVHNEQGAPY